MISLSQSELGSITGPQLQVQVQVLFKTQVQVQVHYFGGKYKSNYFQSITSTSTNYYYKNILYI